MTVTLNLSAETQRKLDEHAARAGRTLEAYLEELVERDTQIAHGGAADQLSLDEFDQRLDDLSEGLPPLSSLPADWSRTDLYAEHD